MCLLPARPMDSFRTAPLYDQPTLRAGDKIDSATRTTAAVAAAADALCALMLSPNEPALNTLVSDALSYGHSNGKLDTKAEFIADLLSRRSHFITIDITDQTITLAGDTAVLRHTLQAITLDSGQPGKVHLFVLQIWHHTHAGWQLLARQAVRPPSPD